MCMCLFVCGRVKKIKNRVKVNRDPLAQKMAELVHENRQVGPFSINGRPPSMYIHHYTMSLTISDPWRARGVSD